MLHFVYTQVNVMGIVKISDELHQEVRKTSSVMERSINAQAEFWMKIGRLAEQNPTLSFDEIIDRQMRANNLTSEVLASD